jgi:two-component sensor histidine kinase
MNKQIANARARVAALSRSRKSNDQTFLQAKRDLVFANLIQLLEKNLDPSPNLDETQIATLKNLIEGLSQGRGAR